MSIEELSKQGTDGCRATGLHTDVTASGGATRVLTAAETGGTFLFDAASGVTFELPTPVLGMEFTFYATVSVTSNAHVIVTDAATSFLGGAIQQVIAANAVSEGQVGDDASDVTISMNGTTTGGLEGTKITVLATSSTTWVATGLVVSSGTLATPFA